MLARTAKKEEQLIFSNETYALYNRRKYDFLSEETKFLGEFFLL